MSEQEEPPEKIKDVEDYTQERRLKSIFDLRDELHQQRKRVRIAEADREDEFAALCVYRGIVDSYILELEPLLRKYESGLEYLTQSEFGEVKLGPDIKHHELGMGRGTTKRAYCPKDNSYKSITEVPEPYTFELVGLQSLLEVQNPIEVEFTFTSTGHGVNQWSHNVTGQVSIVTLDKMVRTMNTFLADIGFELEPEEEDNPAHIGV